MAAQSSLICVLSKKTSGPEQFVCANQPKNFVGLAQRADGIGRTCPVNREEIYSINSRPAGCDGNVQWPRVVHSCGGCRAGFEGIDCNRVSIPVDAEAGPIDTLKTIDVNGDQHDIVFLPTAGW